MIRVGTASWTDPTLLEAGWYPPGVKSHAEKRLRYYAERFNTVEVDSTYYAIPRRRVAELWAERTADLDFDFNVKAYSALTRHGVEARALPKDLRQLLPDPEATGKVSQSKLPPELVEEAWVRFFEALEPLRDAGKLGYTLFQFPPWFKPSEETYGYLKEVATRAQAAGHLPAVEFRHASWYREDVWPRVRELLREWSLVHVVVDAPRAKGAPPLVPEVTNEEAAVLRCHGRNAETWWAKTSIAAERFDYWYTEEEIDELVQVAKGELAPKAKRLYVIFNNNYGLEGVTAARMFMERAGVRR